MKIIVVAAVSRNGFIGKNGVLPWRIPAEMKHFHEVTYGKAMIVGNKTYRSLPKKMQTYQPMFVVTSEPGHDLLNIIRVAKFSGFREIYVIGGAFVYEQATPMADELIISYIRKDVDGDIKMPKIQYSKWTAYKVKKNEEFTTIWWKRKNASILPKII